MFMPAFIIICFTVNRVQLEPLLPSVAGKLNKVIFVYPMGVQSERDLNICPMNSACSVIHKRFWLPPLVERLCRCTHRQECAWTWSPEPDNYTVALDNRSQMKFCSDLSELPDCTLKKPAIRVVTKPSNFNFSNNTTFTKHRLNQKTIKQAYPRNVTSYCQCKEPHYWKIKANWTKFDEENDSIQQFYTCSKLKKCNSMEFCGYVRTDTFSSFYRCSCPKKHMCISKEKTTFKIEEILFDGYGYKAFCFPL